LLDVSDDVVVALLRILDRPDIQPREPTQALAQSAIQYHTVTNRLTEFTSDDPEDQRLVTQAQAAMTAGHFNGTKTLLRKLEDREVTFSNRPPSGVAEAASFATLHLIRAAQAGTVLGEIALMQLRYGEATDYFQVAQQRLALLSDAEPGPAESQAADAAPARSTDAPSTADTRPSLPRSDVWSAGQAGSVHPIPQIDPGHSTKSREQSSATIRSDAPALNQLAAVVGAAPNGLPATTGSPSAGAVLSADLVAILLRRGDALLALGDVTSARRLYRRAAAGGDGRGATGAGKTYDPQFLLAMGARGIRADPVAAATWYRRAIELGDQSAAECLTRMSQGTAR
jgi:TPR repeat protein